MTYEIRFGDVWRADGQTPVCSASEELAIAYDPEYGTPLKIGGAEGARRWLASYLAAPPRRKRHGGAICDPLVAAMPVSQAAVDLLSRISDNSTLVASMIARGELPGATTIAIASKAL